jgi:hypothetical protein
MLDPRDEFWSAEFRRYAAECQRLASAAQPPAKPVQRKRKPKRRAAEWLGTIVKQINAPGRRRRKLIVSPAHR